MQRMVAPGVDVRIHCLNDVDVGPVVIVDLGSLPFTRPGDGHASRLAPLGTAAATALLHASPVADALATTGLDPEALIDTIVRVSHLVADHPQLAEVDINPVIVSTQGCAVTDARVVVRATTGPVARSASSAEPARGRGPTVAAMEHFTDRIAVVTGGGTGMGRELVRQLAAEGCHVAMCDVDARGDGRDGGAVRRGVARPAGSRRSSPTCPTSSRCSRSATRSP